MELAIRLLTTGGLPVTGLTKANVNLRDPDNPAIVYDYTDLGEIGYGQYVFWGINFARKPCRIYVNDVSQTQFGVLLLGDPDLIYIRKDESTISANSKKIVSLADGVLAGDAVNLGQLSTLLATLMTLSTSQNVTGIKRFLNNIFVPYGTDNGHAVNLGQVTSLINAFTQFEYQESPNIVRVIGGGDEQPGMVYNTIERAIDSFTGLADNYQATILLMGTGIVSKFISVSSAKLKNYLHIVGLPNVNLILGGNLATPVANMTLKNLKVYLGGNDITTDRTLGTFTLENCEVFAWKNTTYNNCILKNSLFHHSSGKQAIFAGATKVINCQFDQEWATPPDTVKISGSDNGWDTTFGMPADPTLSSES